MDPDYLSRAKPQGARFVKDHFDGKKLVWTIKHILFWESQTCHPIRLTTLSWRVLYGFFYEISYLSDDEIFWGRFLNSILTCFYSLNISRCKECNIDPRKSIPFNLKYLCPSYYEQEYLPVRYLYPVLTSWNASHWYIQI